MPPANFEDLTDQVFNRLTVIKRAKNTKNNQARWACKCICGNTTTVQTSHLKSGRIASCGCLKRELFIKRSFVHGLRYTPEYKSWIDMIQRCTNPNNKSFKNYGGRGITVCKEWRNCFATFFEDMGKKTKKLTLERINNDLGYSPTNCEWATRTVQANNNRHNHRITLHGWTMNLCQWAHFVGISQHIICKRIYRKWPKAKAIFTPVRHR